MIRAVHIDRILIFNDFPDLFIGKDAAASKYLCLLTKFTEHEYQYHCVQISTERLYNFTNGQLDLKTIFESPELNEIWQTSDVSSENIELKTISIEAFTADLLPDEGFFYRDFATDDIIHQEVVEHENVIVHLSLSDENNTQSISIEDLGDFSKLYQAIVENAYKKTMMNSELKEKKSYIIPQNYTLRAFAASPGSFNLHLKSTSNKDLFGNSILEDGLRILDSIISDPDKQEELIENLKRIKGHTISNYRKLLEKVIDKKLTFKYKWLAPNSKEAITRVITREYAQKVKDILYLKDELVEETKEFIGYMKQADVDRGNWRITNEDDNKDYSGDSETHLLDGITLETVKYKLVCLEIIEALKVTEKEKTTYILKSIEEA